MPSTKDEKAAAQCEKAAEMLRVEADDLEDIASKIVNSEASSNRFSMYEIGFNTRAARSFHKRLIKGKKLVSRAHKATLAAAKAYQDMRELLLREMNRLSPV